MSRQPTIAFGGRATNEAVAAIAAIDRWVCWREEPSKTGRPTKVPYMVSGRKASSTDPRTWDGFDACWPAAFVENRFHGIGLALDGDGLMAADLDDCFEDGKPATWAQEVVARLAFYTEVSPSGEGLRVFFKGTMPDKGRSVRYKGGHLELYRAKRYLTVTGNHLAGTSETINPLAPEVIAELLGPAKANGSAGSADERLDQIPTVSPELRERFKAALRSDLKLKAAWNGAPPDRNDQTRSAYDLKLAGAMRRNGGFTLPEFAAIASRWKHGKGAEGDSRHWARTWAKVPARASMRMPRRDLGASRSGLFAEHEIPEPYPIETLPPTLRRAVEAYQAFGQQPVELVACSALAATSLACQGLADVDRDGGNLVGATSLSFLTVAQSGERKTACDRRMRRALTRWVEEKGREMLPAIQAAEKRLALWQARQDGLLAKIKRLAGSLKPDDQDERLKLESLLLGGDRERPSVPPLPHLFYENVTPEKLTTLLAVNWPSASLWSDEAGIVVGSHAMSEDSALRFLAMLNALWDARPIDRWRETRASAVIKGRRFTVSLMMQPQTLARLVGVDTEDQAPADDLNVINPTHHPPGRLLLLRAVDQGRPVTVRHAQGGPGEIHLAQGLALTLQQPRTWLLLLRRGDIWHEVLRAYGDDAAGARAFLDLWSRREADARFARLAAANLFTQDQLIQHSEGDDTRCQIKRGGIDLALLAAAAEGRFGTLSGHDLVLLRQNQPKVTLQANRVEFDGHVDANGRFRTLGTVRTEMRSGAANGILETGTDHNLLIRRNAVAHIEMRGDSTTDFKQPITRQDHIVWDNANTPRSLGQNGYQQLPSGWIIQWGFAASWGSGDGTITFPIAFPVACRSVQATHLGPDNQFWSARSLTTTSFVIRTSSSANSGYWWLAIGR